MRAKNLKDYHSILGQPSERYDCHDSVVQRLKCEDCQQFLTNLHHLAKISHSRAGLVPLDLDVAIIGEN